MLTSILFNFSPLQLKCVRELQLSTLISVNWLLLQLSEVKAVPLTSSFDRFSGHDKFFRAEQPLTLKFITLEGTSKFVMAVQFSRISVESVLESHLRVVNFEYSRKARDPKLFPEQSRYSRFTQPDIFNH